MWYRRAFAIALLFLGIDFWLMVLHGELGDYRVYPAIGICAVAAVGWAFRKSPLLYPPLFEPEPQSPRPEYRGRGLIAGFVAILVALHLFFLAHRFRDDLYLKFHDEHVYLIQAHMLAHGRMWMGAYPPEVRGFFESFYLIVDRVCAGMYPLGTPLLLLPGVWLGMGHWVMPAIAGSVTAGIFYLLLADIFGTLKAAVGILLLVSLDLFTRMSLMAMSETPLLAAEMLCFLAWMRWRKSRRVGWLLVLGAAIGYGAITRPADMFCVALAIAIAMAWELRRQPRKIAVAAGWITLAITPFAILQIIQDVGVTGTWDRTPIRYYTDQNYPAPILSFVKVSASDVPHTDSLPKQQMMSEWVLPAYIEHSNRRWWQIWYPQRTLDVLHQTLTHPTLAILLPLAILSLAEIRRAALFASLVFFILIYSADAVFLTHYLLAIAPMMICLVLMAWESLERAFGRVRISIAIFMTGWLGATAVLALPQLNPRANLHNSASDEQKTIDRTIASLPHRPAIVLFRFDPKINSYDTEPVYNDGVAWPDDAMIVRAHDLGAREDLRIYRYYAAHGQNREVYLYDRGKTAGVALSRLGTVDELAAGNGGR
jgi:hypothetical protein